MRCMFMLAASAAALLGPAAQAAPILVESHGRLQSIPLFGAEPPNFDSPIDPNSSYSAYWIIEDSAVATSSYPLEDPWSGDVTVFEGAVLEFGAVISGGTLEPLVLGAASGNRGRALLTNDAEFIFSNLYADQFSAFARTYIEDGSMIQEIASSRDLGDGVFIYRFSLDLWSVAFDMPSDDLLSSEAFPDIGHVIDNAMFPDLRLTFSQGEASTPEGLAALPAMHFFAFDHEISWRQLNPVEVAEPAMLGLFGLGGLLMAYKRRRRA